LHLVKRQAMGKIQARTLHLERLEDRLNITRASLSVDPIQSILTVSGNIDGNRISEQGSGSLTTHYSGTIVSALDGNSINFVRDGTKAVAGISGIWQPAPLGRDGSDYANYAGEVGFGWFFTAKAAVRELEVSIYTERSLSLDGTDHTRFNASQMLFSITRGRVDYNVKPGYQSLAGQIAQNQATDAGVFSNLGNGEFHLVMPIDVSFTIAVSDHTLELNIHGTLKADVYPALWTSEIIARGRLDSIYLAQWSEPEHGLVLYGSQDHRTYTGSLKADGTPKALTTTIEVGHSLSEIPKYEPSLQPPITEVGFDFDFTDGGSGSVLTGLLLRQGKNYFFGEGVRFICQSWHHRSGTTSINSLVPGTPGAKLEFGVTAQPIQLGLFTSTTDAPQLSWEEGYVDGHGNPIPDHWIVEPARISWCISNFRIDVRTASPSRPNGVKFQSPLPRMGGTPFVLSTSDVYGVINEVVPPLVDAFSQRFIGSSNPCFAPDPNTTRYSRPRTRAGTS